VNQGTTIRNQPNTTGVNRKPDVWVEDAQTGQVLQVYEAARKNKNGSWVARERRKELDYQQNNIPSHFEPV
jgi:hypothetical protein